MRISLKIHTGQAAQIAVLCLLIPTIQAFEVPCIYQTYKCGFNLVNDHGYTISELAEAVTLTPSIPNLTSAPQLLQVLFRCYNTNGLIAGNSFCLRGCIDMMQPLFNDQCFMS